MELNKILFVLLFMMLTMTYCVAVDTDDVQFELSHAIQRACELNNVRCKVEYVDNIGYNAYTDGYRIYISNKLKERLNIYELKSVAYHEVGHIVHRHIPRTQSFMRNKKNTKHQINTFRKKNELEADMFVVHYSDRIKETNLLPLALTKLVHKNNWNKSSLTHPSVMDRIRYMEGLDLR